MKSSLALAPLLALVAGCGGGMDTSDAPLALAVVQGEVEYTGSTAILESYPVHLKTTVTMRNRSSSATTLELGPMCPVHLSRSTGRRSVRRRHGTRGGCWCAPCRSIIVELAAGDTAQHSTRTDARGILGDSLPDESYFLSAYVQVMQPGDDSRRSSGSVGPALTIG